MDDERIVELLGGPFLTIELLSGDLVFYLDVQDDKSYPINKTGTSVSGVALRGPVLIAEKSECDLSA
jgi:hypothetical protein